ncbi:hypothetical protein Q8A67_009031 [Cirrhinus molitorella]|uniref:ATP synthase subunit C lysine N-methyltransferase n=1 Tax=Cirrhinus molitorella TaxID=172907 RepID=A0AA88Q366_9TELE|nr:hypothetical protein Q8A67_009031 [Cirrhinus molitorella]
MVPRVKLLVVKNNSGVTPAGLCGTWVKEPEGGLFTSPNYPEKYPPERECIYIIEASPRQCIDLYFDEKYAIEPSWECKFDHIEVRDGPFSFSPIIGRYCGQESPTYVRSSGRYLWIKFVADGELEAIGFSARYNFTQEPDLFEHAGAGIINPLCEFEMSGPEGIVESVMVTKEGKALQTEAVDCRWFIRAPPGSKIYLRFLDYEMQNSNECKRNFVAVYDGSSSVEHLKNKFCSTVANDVMLLTSLGVIRMWADETSRRSRFRILFTTFHEPPCEGDSFFCHSNMCINHTLVCNGIQNCVYPWDENGCKEKRKATILDSLDNTNVTIIGVTCGVVIILLTVSIIIQIKQPRKKYIIRRDEFDPTLLHEAFEPPHYELCTLRQAASSDGEVLPEDFPKLQRTSSKCIHGHHCGSQVSSTRGSRSDLSLRDGAAILSEMEPSIQPPFPLQATPTVHRNILVMKHSYSHDGAEECDLDDELYDGPTTSRGRAAMDRTVHRMSDFGTESNTSTETYKQGSGEGSFKKRLGIIATCVVGGSLVALYAVTGPFVAPALRKVCLPFVPATRTQIENVLKVLKTRSGSLVDIGSGDGRIVIAAAKSGFKAVGFELNPWLVWYSRYKAWREGVHHNTSFYISDLWKVSFSEYSNVVIFGVPQMMEQLEVKLQTELQSSAKVVACRFPFPTWTPDDVAGEGIDTVWVYNAETFKPPIRNDKDSKRQELMKN